MNKLNTGDKLYRNRKGKTQCIIVTKTTATKAIANYVTLNRYSDSNGFSVENKPNKKYYRCDNLKNEYILQKLKERYTQILIGGRSIVKGYNYKQLEKQLLNNTK